MRAVTDARGGIRDIDELIDFTLTYGVGWEGGTVKLVSITHELLIKI